MQSSDLSSAEYRKQVDSDVARRSSGGGFVYLGFVAVLWATTDYASHYPEALAVIGLFTALCASMRLFLAYRLERYYALHPRGWRTAYFLAVNLNMLAWGGFLAFTLLFFGYEDWKTMLVLICLSGTAPVALASLSPDLTLLRSFLIALTFPMICANLYVGGARGYSMALVFFWYLIFTCFHASAIHRQYVQYTQEKFALAAAKRSAEDANKAKTEFLAHMSHELKTPLNAIFGMTHLALNTLPGLEQRQYLQGVTSSGEMLLKMLDGLLAFSKIEAGKVELESLDFVVRDLADETLRTFSADLQRKGLRLESSVENEVPPRLTGDSLRLRQVLINVVGNAVKFTSEGKIDLHISVVNQSDDRVTLQFVVRDTGVGIAPEKHRAIFAAFEQADSSTTRKYGGSGLGLAISSRIVDLMGGRMWVESEPGRGSSFYWTASFARPALKETEPARSPDKALEARAGVNVLVAEDYDLGRNLLTKLLEKRGHRVTAVSNGTEAVLEVQRQIFDVVLMDIHMPELNGVEATAEIRRREQAGAHVPIIAVTADAVTGLEDYYLAAGFTGYLGKPIKPEALFAIIEGLDRPLTRRETA